MATEDTSETDINPNPNDTFKILIATDIHLGYDPAKNRDAPDSLATFEEILQYGKRYNVDFILLGGDLFHDAKPSQIVMQRCIDLLRKYCLGPKKIKIEFMSHPDDVFKHCTHKIVNFEDPNFNVSIPVFSIHGNHDDPNFGAVGSMDLLASTGLVNYFGKWSDLSKLVVSPLIIRKGESLIALYGLSYINDQRLSRLLRNNKLAMLTPENETEYFNICVLHQNRAKHSNCQYIPETQLPHFLNFIVWGHEHECRITPEPVTNTGYYICQPGSSIATSLTEGEAQPKHVGLLIVHKSKFKLKKLRLKTVRPFVFENLDLNEIDIKTKDAQQLCDAVYDYVDNLIENTLIPKAAEQLTQHPNQPLIPLLRLRIFYTSEDQKFDVVRLAQKYLNEIMNPMDAIIWRKGSMETVKHSKNHTDVETIEDIYNCECEAEWTSNVQDGVKSYFEKNKDMLSVLSVDGLNEALQRCVQNSDTDAFRHLVSYQMQKTIDYLESREGETPEEFLEQIHEFRNKRIVKEEDENAEIRELLDKEDRAPKNRGPTEATKTGKSTGDSDSDETNPQEEVTKGKAIRGRTKTRGRGRGRGAKKSTDIPALDVTTTKISNTEWFKRNTAGSKRSKPETLDKASSQFSSESNDMMIIDSAQSPVIEIPSD